MESLRRHGGSWRVATEIGDIEAPTALNCAGGWGGILSAMVGEPVPLEIIAPMLMVTMRMPHFLRPTVLNATQRCTLRQRPNGTLLMGGGRSVPDAEAMQSPIDFDVLTVMAGKICRMFPCMENAILQRAWSAVESQLPDNIPIIGPSNTEERLFHAFGFSAHGFAISPIIGVIMADLVLTGRTSLPITPFAIGRFRQGFELRRTATARY